MKDFLDFEGKSVEQAVDRACQELNLDKNQLAYDIISYGSTGIFGLVRTKKALIRVAVPKKQKASETAETANREQGEDFEADNRSEVSALIDEAFGDSEEEDEAAGEEDLGDFVPAEAYSAEEQMIGEEGYAEDEQDEGAAGPAPATDEAVAVARDLLSRILALLSPDAAIDVHRDPDLCRIHITGGETAMLIGRKGQTLEAMQYLLDKAVNKQCGKGYRIVVDVEGYLETRRSELQEMASRLAEKAHKTGKPTTMNRMNAHDRRIVHLALKNNKSVRTQSVGDGYYRKLMILPKRRKRSAKPSGRTRQSQ
ncbi:MAG: RNA-binding cell elongation regulator Jag/EloR [Desulfosalsimonadaceae bacterium]